MSGIPAAVFIVTALQSLPQQRYSSRHTYRDIHVGVFALISQDVDNVSDQDRVKVVGTRWGYYYPLRAALRGIETRLSAFENQNREHRAAHLEWEAQRLEWEARLRAQQLEWDAQRLERQREGEARLRAEQIEWESRLRIQRMEHEERMESMARSTAQTRLHAEGMEREAWLCTERTQRFTAQHRLLHAEDHEWEHRLSMEHRMAYARILAELRSEEGLGGNGRQLRSVEGILAEARQRMEQHVADDARLRSEEAIVLSETRLHSKGPAADEARLQAEAQLRARTKTLETIVASLRDHVVTYGAPCFI